MKFEISFRLDRFVTPKGHNSNVDGLFLILTMLEQGKQEPFTISWRLLIGLSDWRLI
jgi:hypothetical protein